MDNLIIRLLILLIILSLIGTILLAFYFLKLTNSLNKISSSMQIKAAKLDIIENLLSLGIYVADTNGTWTYVNNTMAILFGMQPSEMVGNGWLRNIKASNDVYQKWVDCIKQQIPYTDIITVKIGGKLNQFEISTLPVLTDGKYSAYVGTVKPIITQ